jgi:hypothetical protein
MGLKHLFNDALNFDFVWDGSLRCGLLFAKDLLTKGFDLLGKGFDFSCELRLKMEC